MKRAAFLAAAITVAIAAPTVGGMATAAAPTSPAQFVAPGPQRMLDSGRALMLQVPDQRVAGIVSHVEPSCTGDGQDGKRVQVLYVRSRTAPALTAAKRAQILDEVRTVDDVFAASAAKTGGGLRVRWVSRADCVPAIEDVAVSPAALAGGFDVMKAELGAQGHDRADRKYLVFSESNQSCGTSDGNVPGSVSRIDRMCWPLKGTSIAAHELGHALGAVWGNAPHHSGWGHCTETGDLMCNGQHAPEDPVVRACPAWQGNWFDCGNDDYFSTDPAPGSYLDSERNIARSPFLDTVAPLPPAPEVRVSAAPAPAAARARGGQVVIVRATASAPVAGWKFPPVAGRCRLSGSEGGPALRTQAGTATYACLQDPGTRATFTVQALSFNERVGYGSADVTVTGAPVSLQVPSRAVAGRPFTAVAVGDGGDDRLLYWWKGGQGCRTTSPGRSPGPRVTLTCAERMAGRSVSVSVSVYRRDGEEFKVTRQVALGR